MLVWLKSVPIVVLLALGSGCACHDYCCNSTGCATSQFACEPAQPHDLAPDVSLVPRGFSVDQSEQYCALSAANAQCLAAKNSQSGNLLDKEADAVDSQRKCLHDGSEMASELLRLEAIHKRNLDAAIALEAFLRLAEAEGGVQNVNRRLKEVDAMLADVTRLRQRGMLPPVSGGEIESQRLQLLHRRAEVQSTIGQLNVQLSNLMGTNLPLGSRYWPEVDLAVNPEIPDREEAVSVALGNRADLAALRVASQGDDREILAAARVLLQPLGGGMGTSSSKCGLSLLLHPGARREEAEARARQISAALQESQRSIRLETLQAIDLIQTRLAQVAILRQRMDIAVARLNDTAQSQQLTATPLSLHQTRLDGLAVDQDLLHDVIDWKIAQVKLKAAQGILAVECGWNAASQACQ